MLQIRNAKKQIRWNENSRLWVSRTGVILCLFLPEQAGNEGQGHDRHGDNLNQDVLHGAHVDVLQNICRQSKNPSKRMGLERVTRLELATSTLARWRSTG